MIELVNNLVADHRNTAEPLRMGADPVEQWVGGGSQRIQVVIIDPSRGDH